MVVLADRAITAPRWERYYAAMLARYIERAGELVPQLPHDREFVDDQCRSFISACRRQYVECGEIAPMALIPELNRLRCFHPDGAAGFILDLVNAPDIDISTVMVPKAAAEIRRAAEARHQEQIAQHWAQMIRDGDDPSEALSYVRAELWELERATASDKPRFRLIPASELASAAYEQSYLIDNVLVCDDLCILGGPEKSLKTSLLVDMFVALAAGGYFLGTFPVNRKCRTLLFSGESGKANLQDIARRVCNRAGYDLATLENFTISTDLPQLDNATDLLEFERVIVEHDPDVIGIDPMFLCLGESDDRAGNMFSMGPILRRFVDLCQRVSAVGIIAHHTTAMAVGTTPELSNLAWAGFKQTAGQWILLNRRERYEPGSGEHRMIMVTGGRAGHNLARALDISEGTREGIDGRHWAVTVSHTADAREAAEQRKVEAKEAAAERQRDADRRAVLQAAAGLPGQAGTKTDLRDRSGIRTDRFNNALAGLLRDRHLEPCVVTKHGRDYEGYRLTDDTET